MSWEVFYYLLQMVRCIMVFCAKIEWCFVQKLLFSCLWWSLDDNVLAKSIVASMFSWIFVMFFKSSAIYLYHGVLYQMLMQLLKLLKELLFSYLWWPLDSNIVVEPTSSIHVLRGFYYLLQMVRCTMVFCAKIGCCLLNVGFSVELPLSLWRWAVDFDTKVWVGVILLCFGSIGFRVQQLHFSLESCSLNA
jgi:hypothetical protein